MDHNYVEGHNLADRYLHGKLSPTERARFEEHFVDCAKCLDRLEMTVDFCGALRTVAAEEAATSRVYARPRVRTWLMGVTGGRQPALLAAAAVLLVVLPSAFLIVEIVRSRDQVDQARLSASDWQRRYEESRQAARTAEQELQVKEQELSRQRLEIEAERERGRQARVTEEVSRQAQLQPTAPIFDLNTVRSGSPGQLTLATRISIPASARWIVLKLEIEPDPQVQTYRATLLTSAQRVICRASDAIAVNEALAISCDSSLFTPGDYRLTLEGVTGQGRRVPAGTYSFQVIKQ